VLEVYLFGSTARGESRPHSDIDIAVYRRWRSRPNARSSGSSKV